MEFTYHGMVRQGFWFDNPNHAAALFAMLLPLLWGIRCAPRCPTAWRVISLVCETLLFAGLIATYSRSGLVAVTIALAVFMFSAWYGTGWRPFPGGRRGKWLRAALLPAVVAGLLLATSGGRTLLYRLCGGISAPDASVLNRFKVWRGALVLWHDNPLGVGSGNSGFLYTVGLHHGSDLTGYRTMVNSFLTFAVEYGLPAAMILSAMLFLAFGAGLAHLLRSENPEKDSGFSPWLTAGLLAALAAGCFAGLMSSCFDITPAIRMEWSRNNIMQTILLMIFALLFAVLLLRHGRYLFLCRPFMSVGIAALALLLCLTIWGVGGVKRSAKIVVSSDRWASLWPDTPDSDSALIRYLPHNNDPAELRSHLRIIRSVFRDAIIAFPLPDAAYPPTMQSGEIAAAVSPENIPPGNNGIIFHPAELPPERLPEHIVKVLLDANDKAGVNRYWQRVAETHIIPDALQPNP